MERAAGVDGFSLRIDFANSFIWASLLAVPSVKDFNFYFI